ncbi:hypothetical protein [Frankia gtarii]|uniref:hypothetical protein n=1 Tax=Frankia gtarii TaxID=2950102 RepID=UPI0021BE7B8D|nr:hypothetical protein [Frankia gtarii]
MINKFKRWGPLLSISIPLSLFLTAIGFLASSGKLRTTFHESYDIIGGGLTIFIFGLLAVGDGIMFYRDELDAFKDHHNRLSAIYIILGIIFVIVGAGMLYITFFG